MISSPLLPPRHLPTTPNMQPSFASNRRNAEIATAPNASNSLLPLRGCSQTPAPTQTPQAFASSLGVQGSKPLVDLGVVGVVRG